MEHRGKVPGQKSNAAIFGFTANVVPAFTDLAAALPLPTQNVGGSPTNTGVISRIRVNQFSPTYGQQYQPPPGVSNVGDWTNWPPLFVGNMGPFIPQGQPQRPRITELLGLMIEDNRRRDKILERVVQTLAAQQGNGYGDNSAQQGMSFQVMPDLSKHIETYDVERGGSKPANGLKCWKVCKRYTTVSIIFP